MPNLLLSKTDPFDFAVIARVLADFYKVPFIDAVHRAKQGWGILSEEITEEKALELKNAFSTAGIETRILTEPLPVLPPAQWVASMKFEGSQISCALRNGPPQIVEASKVSLVAACALDENRSIKVTKKEGPSAGQRLASAGIMLATGIPIRIGPKKQTIETKKNISETFFYLDLYDHGASRRLRVDGQRFDYSCLGSKKHYNVAANFKILAKGIHRFRTSGATRPRNAHLSQRSTSLRNGVPIP